MCGKKYATIEVCKKPVQSVTNRNRLISSVKTSDKSLAEDQIVKNARVEQVAGYSSASDKELVITRSGTVQLSVTSLKRRLSPLVTSVTSVKTVLRKVQAYTGSTTKEITPLKMLHLHTRVVMQSLVDTLQQKIQERGLELRIINSELEKRILQFAV